MASERTILITGATGQQGGAVAKHLAGKGFKLRALTRKPDSDKAKALAALGVEIVKGDLDDAASVKQALAGVWGVFGVQNTWEAGVEKEEQQGKDLAKAARAAGVSHFVYTSVGSADQKTGIPHFDNKARVEDTVRGLGFPSWVILRPVFFMENLLGAWFLQGDKLTAGMKPDLKLQVVAVDDIGKLGARAFLSAVDLNGRAIDLAGDTITPAEATAALSAALHRNLEFVSLPLDAVRAHSADMAAMLEWFDKVGYHADIAGVERTYDLRLTRFADWAKQAGAAAAAK